MSDKTREALNTIIAMPSTAKLIIEVRHIVMETDTTADWPDVIGCVLLAQQRINKDI